MAGTREGAIKAWDKRGRKDTERGAYIQSGGGSAAVRSSGDWKGGWPKTEAEFRAMSVDGKADRWAEGARIQNLAPDADLIVYHATDVATAERFLKDGVDTADKPRNVMRDRFERGEYAEFAPGRGVGAGLYVGGTPQGVEGYGRVLLAIRIKRRDLQATPEQKALGYDEGHALTNDDAMVMGRIQPSAIREVGERGRYPTGDPWKLKGMQQ